MESIADLDNLYLAYYKASKGKHGKSEVVNYTKHIDENIQKLRTEFLAGNFRVGSYRYFTIFDPKKRLICAASFPERVLHHAVMNVCHPFFERNLINDTYATRIEKGTYEALDKALRAMSRYQYVVKLDVKKYFDIVSHEVLKAKLRRLYKDRALLCLFDAIIDSYSTTMGRGIPIGNLTSQYFANYYLSEVDHFAKETLKIPVYLRYMDDILFFGNEKALVREQVAALKTKVETLELELKPVIINRTEVGTTFLSYRIRRHCMTLNARSRNRLKKKLRQYDERMEKGEWNELDYHEHITPLIAFAEKAYSKSMRRRILTKIEGQKSHARTACFAAAAGTTTQGTAECRIGTTTNPTTGTTTTGSASFFPSLRFQGVDFPGKVKQISVPFPQ
jgi:retron-type reverse transcriptase